MAWPLSTTRRANFVDRGPPIGGQSTFQQGSKFLPSAADQLPSRPSHRSPQPSYQQGLGPHEIASEVPIPQLPQASRELVSQPGATAGPSATQVLGDMTPPYRPRQSLYTRSPSSYANTPPHIPEEIVEDSENEESATDVEQLANSDSDNENDDNLGDNAQAVSSQDQDHPDNTSCFGVSALPTDDQGQNEGNGF